MQEIGRLSLETIALGDCPAPGGPKGEVMPLYTSATT